MLLCLITLKSVLLGLCKAEYESKNASSAICIQRYLRHIISLLKTQLKDSK